MRVSALCLALAGLALGGRTGLAENRVPDPTPSYQAERLTFAALEGWATDDHASAFAVFRRSCGAVAGGSAVRNAHMPDNKALVTVCRAALDSGEPSPWEARAFFETRFEPVAIRPESGSGFLTGYFEPEYRGSLARTEIYSTPLLARPDDLIEVSAASRPEGFPAGISAGRRGEAGIEAYPDRAAIESGALGEHARPIVFLADPIEAFVIHVQGSARIRLEDGHVLRVAFAARNGHPYTSIGRALSEREQIPPSELGLEQLVAWLRAHPDTAQDLMRLNRSYIFFRLVEDLPPGDGPLGGAGVPLTAGRSLAIDRHVWSYGLPVWLEGTLPTGLAGGMEPLRRLVVAQDTGSAIIGPARGDLFFGAGAQAGARAGLVRERVRFVVLRPRGEVSIEGAR